MMAILSPYYALIMAIISPLGFIEIVKGLGANNVLTESFDRKFFF